MDMCLVVSDSVTPWTVAHQAPLSIEFPRQEYWNGLPFTSPGDLPHPGIEPASLVSPALAAGFFATVPAGKPPYISWKHLIHQPLKLHQSWRDSLGRRPDESRAVFTAY